MLEVKWLLYNDNIMLYNHTVNDLAITLLRKHAFGLNFDTAADDV